MLIPSGWNVFRTVVVGLVLLMLAGTAWAASSDSKTIEVSLEGWSAGEVLEVRNLAGRMELVGGQTPSLRVTFSAEPSGGLTVAEIMSLVDVKTGREADHFVVTTGLPLDRFTTYAYPDPSSGTRAESGGILETIGSWFGGFTNSSGKFDGKEVKVTTEKGAGTLAVWADYQLVMPEGVSVTMDNFVGELHLLKAGGDFVLDTGSGDVKTDRTTGSLAVDTGSGDVMVTQFSGSSLSMDTGSGDILVDQADADKLVADTGSGDVEIKAFSGGSCVLDTGSGDVSIDTDLVDCQKMVVDTGSGDVELALPVDAPFSLRADTGSGDVSGALVDARPVMDGDEIIGFDRGHGGTSIMVDTGSGDVLIRNR